MGRWLVTSILLMIAVIEAGTARAANPSNDALLTLAPNEQAEYSGMQPGASGIMHSIEEPAPTPALGKGSRSGLSGVRMARLTWWGSSRTARVC
jgi:hypothetical protein